MVWEFGRWFAACNSNNYNNDLCNCLFHHVIIVITLFKYKSCRSLIKEKDRRELDHLRENIYFELKDMRDKGGAREPQAKMAA